MRSKKLTVNRALCEGHAKCVTTTPQLITIDGTDGLAQVTRQAETETEEAAARLAVDSCPEQALALAAASPDAGEVVEGSPELAESRPDTIPLLDFDHHSGSFASDPWQVYRDMHERCPVSRSEHHGGFIAIAGYEDVAYAARHDGLFSSVEGDVLIPSTDVDDLVPIRSDPPATRRYRRALMPYFTPAYTKEHLDERIRYFTDQAIDRFIEKGSCDLLNELCKPVPIQVVLEMIGIEPDRWEDFAGPIHRHSFARPDSPEKADAGAEVFELRQEIDNLIANRKQDREPGLVSHLIEYDAEGAFTDAELNSLVTTVVFGGIETTMAALGNALLLLSERPADRRRLIDDRELLTSAIEEFLRFEAPVQGFARTATTDTELGGKSIAAGERLFLLWAAANRDPNQFEDPDEFVIDRPANRHLTFGVGAHRCLGAPLARAEMRIVLEQVLRRLPDYIIDKDLVVMPDTIGTIYTRTALPARFTPGIRNVRR